MQDLPLGDGNLWLGAASVAVVDAEVLLFTVFFTPQVIRGSSVSHADDPSVIVKRVKLVLPTWSR